MEVEIVKSQLNKGYIFATVGFLLGCFIQHNENIGLLIFNSLALAYILFSMYWGRIIVMYWVDRYFDVSVHSSTLWDAIHEREKKHLTKILVKIIIGFPIGLLGGAIYKQVVLLLWLRKERIIANDARNRRFRINS